MTQNDGLTDAERAAHAESWRNGAGRTPSKEEMKRLRSLTPAAEPDPQLAAILEKLVELTKIVKDIRTAVR